MLVSKHSFVPDINSEAYQTDKVIYLLTLGIENEINILSEQAFLD